MKPRLSPLVIIIAAGLFLSSVQGQKKVQTDWPTFGNDLGGQRYAPLTQINAGNVTRLVRAWTYHMKPTNAEAPNAETGPPAAARVAAAIPNRKPCRWWRAA